MNKSDLLLMPRPKDVIFHEGGFTIPEASFIVLLTDKAHELLISAGRLQSALGEAWQVTASPALDTMNKPILLKMDSDLEMHEQGYKLEIAPRSVTIQAASPAGIYYGICTLLQLMSQYSDRLPCLTITDWPDFNARGVMLDISRDKVPTLLTLMSLVDLLSEWKINQVQLYTEHTFAYLKHKIVWEHASPMTGEDILLLDKYCSERFVELVPNQNSFGHMERWLKHKEYNSLAEAPKGCETPWGTFRGPFSLCPIDPGSIELISEMYDELLPHFSSKLFNVGCDETFDLGQGRSKEECEKRGIGPVYLDFLIKIHEQVKRHGKKMQFWGDIILHHPELINDLPKDVVALEWGYEANHPFEADGKKFSESGIEYWVCPGTSSWNSVVGRTDNAIGNLQSAAVSGAAGGATGYLNTDWGDNGHFQYLPVSYLGFMYGAAASWNASDTGEEILPAALSAYAFHDEANVMGMIAYNLGNAYTCIAKPRANQTVIFEQLSQPFSNLDVVDGVSEEELNCAIEVAEKAVRDLEKSRMDRPDAEIIKAEFANDAAMVAFACKLGIARIHSKDGRNISAEKAQLRRELEEIISQHERLWLARNRVGGLIDSKQRLEARLEELKD